MILYCMSKAFAAYFELEWHIAILKGLYEGVDKCGDIADIQVFLDRDLLIRGFKDLTKAQIKEDRGQGGR